MFDDDDLAILVDDSLPDYVQAEIGGRVVSGGLRITPGDSFGVVSRETTELRVLFADIPDVVPGDKAIVGGVDYVVSSVRRVSAGLAYLDLRA